MHVHQIRSLNQMRLTLSFTAVLVFTLYRPYNTHSGALLKLFRREKIYHRVVAFIFVLNSIEWMKNNIIYFAAFCASLWKKIRNWSVRRKSKSALKFTTKINRTELTMEQIIANLLVADNAVIQKVSFILRTNTEKKFCQIFHVEYDFVDRNLHYNYW